jgi:ABC-type transport system involved in cytochrome c biogenesis ATPase subunit
VLSRGQGGASAARLTLVRRKLWVLDEPATALDAAGVILADMMAASGAGRARGGRDMRRSGFPAAQPRSITLA